ncbi:MAG: DNA polymerase III subunit delta [Gemmatimonadota bacterium]
MASASATGRKGGVFFLHGEDEFRKERAFADLISAHLEPGVRDFNLDVLRGSDVSVETLASVIGTPPMMAEWRVVLVRDAEALAASARTRAVIEDVLERTPPGLALILVARIPSGSKAKFWTTLTRKARSTEFAPLSQDDVPGWLMSWAREHYQIEVDPDAAHGLAAGVGADLGILDQELAKLRDRVGAGGRVGTADVEAAGTRLPAQDRWRWFDLVGERRFREARRALPVLADQGESGVGLVIGLGAHLLRLGLLVSGGAAALERVLPPHQKWLAKRLRPQARGWTEPELRTALVELARVDRLLKSASFSDEHLLEEWFLALEARSRRAA